VSFLRDLGFEDVRVTARFDPFRGTRKENTARKYGVHGANVFARNPMEGK
jgi:hypothetical protein